MIKNHRMQKLERDPHGVIRFRKNKIVEFLLEEGPFDLNHLAGLAPPAMKIPQFPAEDWRQFAQMLGYSADGYCSLSYVSRAEAHRVEDAVEEFTRREEEAAQVKHED